MSVFKPVPSRRLTPTLCVLAMLCATTHARAPIRSEKAKELKAWVNARSICVFPFAAKELPPTSDAFASAMAQGYRNAIKLPQDNQIVVASGGQYPSVDSLRINVCDGVVRHPQQGGRKPSDKQKRIIGVDAARFELIGNSLSVGDATMNISLTATDARLMFTRDKEGKPLLMLGSARDAAFTAEMSHKDVERFLLAAARKGGKKYGLMVDKTRLKMTVENGRLIRVNLKLFARFAFIPAGLDFLARLDIDDDLNGRVSELSCNGDDVLGPLITGLIRPFLARYNDTTRPLMNFPLTDIRLRDIQITSDENIRVAAAFGSR